MPRTHLGHIVRAAAAVVIASVALTGCAASVHDRSTATPNAEHSPSTAPVSAVTSQPTPEPTPSETEDAGAIQVTGDYQADLAAVGFEPTPEDFEVVTAQHEENICDQSMADLEMFDFNQFESDIESTAENPGVDMLRLVVEYNCPNRPEAVEGILVGLGY